VLNKKVFRDVVHKKALVAYGKGQISSGYPASKLFQGIHVKND
jgi:hypothetical protein